MPLCLPAICSGWCMRIRHKNPYNHRRPGHTSYDANMKEAPQTQVPTSGFADRESARTNSKSSMEKTSPSHEIHKELRIVLPDGSDTPMGLDSPSPTTEGSPGKSSTLPNTALNVFKFALETLSLASENLPAPGVKLIVGTLLSVTNHIQQSSANFKGFNDLAERMRRLEPIFSRIRRGEETMEPFLQDLEIVLKSLTMDMQTASSQGRLVQFFNSTDNSLSLANNMATLDRVIADLTFATTTDTNQGVAQLQEGVKDIQGKIKMFYNGTVTQGEGTKKFGRIIGGMGGAGGNGGQSGGAGGQGGSFKLKTNSKTNYEISAVEVGHGGAGGDSNIQGGQGGAGGGVEINIS